MPPSPNTFGKTILTTAEGQAIAAKNALHAFGMRYPLTLAVIALVIGNIVGVVFHL